MSNKKLIVILGPTASGKSNLAVELAKKFSGEIISADSRQVYKGMDIGTGKITPDTKNSPNFSTGQAKKKYIFIHKGIPHYCIDVALPKRRFTVAQYRKLALEVLDRIYKKHKIPIICGGTGFYIQAVIDGLEIPKVKPDQKLRKRLEKLNTRELFKELKKLDPRRAKNIDSKNRRRLIRALEIVIKTGKPVPKLKTQSNFDVLMIGIKKSPTELKELIRKRLLRRLKQGMIAEVKRLKKSGLSWKRLDDFGLEYRYLAKYLKGELTKQEMIEQLQKETEHYAKRQMTWFKRHPAPEQVRCGASKRIHWITNYREVEKLVEKFL